MIERVPFLRIFIAFCLVADPVTASAFHNPPPSIVNAGAVDNPHFFLAQAFAARLLSAHRFMGNALKAWWNNPPDYGFNLGPLRLSAATPASHLSRPDALSGISLMAGSPDETDTPPERILVTAEQLTIIQAMGLWGWVQAGLSMITARTVVSLRDQFRNPQDVKNLIKNGRSYQVLIQILQTAPNLKELAAKAELQDSLATTQLNQLPSLNRFSTLKILLKKVFEPDRPTLSLKSFFIAKNINEKLASRPLTSIASLTEINGLSLEKLQGLVQALAAEAEAHSSAQGQWPFTQWLWSKSAVRTVWIKLWSYPLFKKIGLTHYLADEHGFTSFFEEIFVPVLLPTLLFGVFESFQIGMGPTLSILMSRAYAHLFVFMMPLYRLFFFAMHFAGPRSRWPGRGALSFWAVLSITFIPVLYYQLVARFALVGWPTLIIGVIGLFIYHRRHNYLADLKRQKEETALKALSEIAEEISQQVYEEAWMSMFLRIYQPLVETLAKFNGRPIPDELRQGINALQNLIEALGPVPPEVQTSLTRITSLAKDNPQEGGAIARELVLLLQVLNGDLLLPRWNRWIAYSVGEEKIFVIENSPVYWQWFPMHGERVLVVVDEGSLPRLTKANPEYPGIHFDPNTHTVTISVELVRGDLQERIAKWQNWMNFHEHAAGDVAALKVELSTFLLPRNLISKTDLTPDLIARNLLRSALYEELGHADQNVQSRKMNLRASQMVWPDSELAKFLKNFKGDQDINSVARESAAFFWRIMYATTPWFQVADMSFITEAALSAGSHGRHSGHLWASFFNLQQYAEKLRYRRSKKAKNKDPISEIPLLAYKKGLAAMRLMALELHEDNLAYSLTGGPLPMISPDGQTVTENPQALALLDKIWEAVRPRLENNSPPTDERALPEGLAELLGFISRLGGELEKPSQRSIALKLAA
jgi:hypothetical protein